jgi:predicted TIM-barrel fold metal-dependent hydrolase
MEIKHGLISCDSHGQLHKDAWTIRMSKAKWGDDIPHLAETSDKEHMAIAVDEPVERWFVHGKVVGDRGVVNCPTVMADPLRKTFPQHWEEVPDKVYDPIKRLAALDSDGIDGEVLFPNDPVQGLTFFQGDDPEFELACVQAYNDALADWRAISDRYIPLAIIPFLGGIDSTVAEVERAANLGHRGIVMMSEPSVHHKTLKHFNDPYWDPLWAVCQDLELPVHWHAGGGLRLNLPLWKGYSRNQGQAVGPAGSFSTQAQFIPNLIFSGVLDRYPRLKWICAETGLGWVNYILEGCDHEWERRHLWTEGILERPSDLFKRQICVDFWCETAGVELRHFIGMENIMWESDYPHSTSTYPESWDFVERTLKGVPQDERNQLLYGNAMRLYHLS